MLLSFIEAFGRGITLRLFDQCKCIRGMQELRHIFWQGEVFEEGHGLCTGYFPEQLQELLVQSGQADQDSTENHPNAAQRQVGLDQRRQTNTQYIQL